jgi:hypothetical protein
MTNIDYTIKTEIEIHNEEFYEFLYEKIEQSNSKRKKRLEHIFQKVWPDFEYYKVYREIGTKMPYSKYMASITDSSGTKMSPTLFKYNPERAKQLAKELNESNELD